MPNWNFVFEEFLWFGRYFNKYLRRVNKVNKHIKTEEKFRRSTKFNKEMELFIELIKATKIKLDNFIKPSYALWIRLRLRTWAS